MKIIRDSRWHWLLFFRKTGSCFSGRVSGQLAGGAKEKAQIRDREMSTGMDITEILFRDFPDMTSGDPAAVGQAGAILADLLGCVLALVKAQITPESYDELVEAVHSRIDRSTNGVISKGDAIRASRRTTNTTQ